MEYAGDDSMDLALADIADNGDELHLVSQAPGLTGGVANYADVATYTLGHVALTPGDGNGAYTIQDGLTSGRRVTLAGQTVLGTGDGTADHAVIIDTTNAKVKSVNEVPNYNMQTGVNQSVPEYDPWEIEDPT